MKSASLTLDEARLRARAAFAAMEWPARKNEAWRHTPAALFPLERIGPGPRLGNALPAASSSGSAGAPAENFQPRPEDTEGAPAWSGRLTLVDGRPDRFFLAPEAAAAGVGLKAELRESEILEEDSLPLAEEDNRFFRSHWAILDRAAALTVPAGAMLDSPFLIEFEEELSAFANPHLWIELGAQARASIILRWQDRGSAVGRILNTGLTVRLAEGAQLSLAVIQDLAGSTFRVDHSRAHLGRDSRFSFFDAAFGAKVTKSGLSVLVEGPGAEVSLSGAYASREEQHKDISVRLVHNAARSTSRAAYRGIARDRGRAIFRGLIEVSEKGSGSDAYLSDKNLILSPGARAASLPQLKIDTNDLKCGHGSSTGRLGDDELVYLASRGFSPEEAKAMAAVGFLSDFIDRAPEAARSEIEALASAAVA
jgi:Fe-S cluster assembly protein SufD